MIDMKKLDEVLLELGHDDAVSGTDMIRQGVTLWDAGCRPSMTAEIYPALAAAAGSTKSRVERNMRHSIQKAWGRNTYDVRQRYFGNSYNPETGLPQVGEYIARLARICRESV